MAGSGKDRAIDYSLDRLCRRRLPSTTLWIVVVAAYHRLLSGYSSPPPAIDYSLNRLRQHLASTTLWIVRSRRCQPSSTLSIASCHFALGCGTEPERNEN